MAFLDDNFMLETETARKLFHDYAKQQPIMDYHCHLIPQEIYENKKYNNLTEVWLGGDHYKWRLMRANGVTEDLVTGDGDAYPKLLAFAGVMEKAIGNPIYEWTHLELRRYFDINLDLNTGTAPIIWEKANEALKDDSFTPREMMKRMNVKLVCTTDDPADDLKYHKLLAKEETAFRVLPTFRPDNAFEVAASGFADYVVKLEGLTGLKIKNFATLLDALEKRVEYFETVDGCLADHGMNDFYFVEASEKEIDAIFQKGLKGKEISREELNAYYTAMQLGLIEIYNRHDWAVQLHMNCLRNVNTVAQREIGINTGHDAVGSEPNMAGEIASLLQAARERGPLPKTVLYSLNGGDLQALASIMGCFQGGGVGRLQLGSGWWFLDTFSGMNHQITTLAEQGLLGAFVGMLTDSRSFLSYPRHEYFRRVLCNNVGNLVETGRATDNFHVLGKLVQNIASNNIVDFLGVDIYKQFEPTPEEEFAANLVCEDMPEL
ncbi:MAG: glucuronate isomerase [Lactobacillales bacterium]|jgi:glucuronate isomerase|nr:glucuronate isomerase [Lactobacillales bacterium]